MNITDPRPPAEDEREVTLLVLLQRVWTYAFTTKSDYAREYADEIAEGASRGFLTTAVIPTRAVYGRLWKLTPDGLVFLWERAGRIADMEVQQYGEEYAQA